MSPRDDSEHAVNIANELMLAFDYDAPVVARALLALAVRLVEDDPVQKTVLAMECLRTARLLEPGLPVLVKRWH